MKKAVTTILILFLYLPLNAQLQPSVTVLFPGQNRDGVFKYTHTLFINSKNSCKIKPEQAVTIPLNSGEDYTLSSAKNKRLLHFTLEEGETRYYEAQERNAVLVMELYLTEITKEEFLRKVQSLTEIKCKP